MQCHLMWRNVDEVCVNTNPAILDCTFNLSAISPDGQHKYLSSQPSWKENGRLMQIGDPRYTYLQPGLMSAELLVNMTENEPANYSCLFIIRDGIGNYSIEESNTITVFSKNKPDVPKNIQEPNITSNSITMMLIHETTCFAMHKYFLSLEVYVNGELKRQEQLMDFEKPINIGNLEPSTHYNITIIARSVEDEDIKSDPYVVTITTKSNLNTGQSTNPGIMAIIAGIAVCCFLLHCN